MNFIKPMKTITSITTLCVVLAFPAMATANMSASDMEMDGSKHHQKKSGYSGKKMMKRMTKALSLTELQQTQIKAIQTQAKEEHESLKASIKQFKETEKSLIQADAFDEQGYIALHTANQQAFANLALSRAKTKHAMFNVLTTEQQEKWLKMKSKRKGRANKT
jgi:Spy/CpxP family protein refolding chaperone